MKNSATLKIQKKIDESFRNFTIDKEKKIKLKNAEVNYKELETELERLINLTEQGLTFENFHSLFIYGPTGVGKSELVKEIAERNNCVYHKLEIQKIPIEEFEGFPYLEDDETYNKVVRLAHPTVLPPSNDDKTWVLHLDEFNKADSDKMAAVMNLVLTGEIGGAADYNKETGKSERYRLPKKTVIVGSGNFKTQENTENLNLVNQMDIATSERFHRAVLLDYNAISWLENFANKPIKFNKGNMNIELSSRIAPIIMYYIMDKMSNDGNKSPFLIPISFRPDEGGGERTASPRSWTLISDNMLLDAIYEYNTTDHSFYDNLSEATTENKNSSFELFFNDPNNQIKFFGNQVLEFGLDGNRIVEEVISRYKYFAENRLTADDILYKYREPEIRERARALQDRLGIALYLLISCGYAINAMNDTEDIKLKSVCVSSFIEDAGISGEDLSVFAYIIKNSKNKVSKEYDTMFTSISKKYRDISGDMYFTAKEELIDIKKKGKKVS